MSPISTADFLDVVLPKGIHYLGYTNGRLGPSGRPVINCAAFDLGAQAVKRAGRSNMDGEDIYFALASFKQAKIYDEKNGYEKSYRHQDNVAKLKSIWLDVDFKSYDDEKSAVLDVKAFLTNTPNPTFIVNSGGGLHLYWTFEQELTPAAWQPLAQGLAGLAKQLGLRADFGVTIDSARVLRLPGSFNQKYPNKPEVTIAGMGAYASLERMEELLLPHSAGQAHAGARITMPDNVINLFDPAANADLSAGYAAQSKSSFEKIIADCPTIAASWANNGADDSYTLWKDILHLAAFTTDGSNYIHDISSGYANYDADETTARFDESVIIKANGSRGPTLCSRFSASSSKCATCKHLGKIKTPWSLGVTRQATEEPTNVVGETTYLTKWVSEKDENGDTALRRKQVRILDASLDNWRLIPALDKGSIAEMWVDCKMGRYAGTIKMDMAVAADSKLLRGTLVGKHFGIQEKELPIFKEATMAWINNLKSQHSMHVVDGFGWSRDGNSFVVGNTHITDDGDLPVAISEALESEYVATGTPDAWNKLSQKLCNDVQPEFSFLMAAGFAAPLMGLGFAMSLSLSAYSKASGVGKTTAFKTIQAAWGDPYKMFALDDTANYITERVGLLKNLPALWDEVRGDKAAQNLLTTMFRINQGKTKGRLDSSAGIKGTHNISTLLMSATNIPMSDYVSQEVRQTDAGFMRFLEFCMDMAARPIDFEINALTSLLDQNYGHAGLAYARFLVANRKALVPMLAQVEKDLLVFWKPAREERFWFHGIAKIITAAHLMKQSGIVDIDPDRVRDFALKVKDDQKKKVERSQRDNIEIINDIFNANQSAVLYTTRYQVPGGKDIIPTTGTLPMRGVQIHVSVDAKMMRVSKYAIDEYCLKNALSASAVILTLKEKYKAVSMRYTPGAGCGITSTQTRGFEMALDKTVGEDIVSGMLTSAPPGPGTSSPPASP
tara:strand:+ start:1882 stop:4740 length:2859 start_codon:yes stop_codon:yes gene_type:complete